MSKLSKQVSLGYDPVTGKRVRKWIHADSKPALKQAEKDAIAEYAKNGLPSRITLEAYQKQWLESISVRLTPHTQYCYQNVLKHLAPLAHKQMAKILRSDLQKILNQLWDKPNMCRKLSGLMKQIWRSAVLDGVIDKDITIGLQKPKIPKSERRAFTAEELEAIKNVKLPERDRFFVDVLYQFGLRPGEAFALNQHSFDRKNRTLTIDKSVAYNQAGEPYIKGTKTGVTRVLPVPDSFWQKIPKTKTVFYFTKSNGELLRRGGALDMCKKILSAINAEMGGSEALKMTDITMYSFRHHKASILYYMSGVSLKKKAEYMGHSEEMFLKTYSHMIEEKEETEALRAVTNL